MNAIAVRIYSNHEHFQFNSIEEMCLFRSQSITCSISLSFSFEILDSSNFNVKGKLFFFNFPRNTFLYTTHKFP